MRFDRMFGVAAIALAGLWCANAGAQSDSATVIHLHLPGEKIHLHPIRHRPSNTPAPAPTDNAGAEAAASDDTSAPTPAAPLPAASRAKTAHGHNAAGSAAIPFNFGDDDTPPPAGSGEAPLPDLSPGLKTASLPPHATAPAHAVHTPTSDDDRAGLSKHGAVLFEKGVADPTPAQFKGVKLLAGDLATALESGASRVQLDAYGGAPGDKSSDARRLSLKRALAVRQLLIDNGVPSSRIDVRAMGGVDDKGPTDRVDVFVRAG
ncbi:MAG: OmpA family protein [Rhizomicrobium sp.]